MIFNGHYTDYHVETHGDVDNPPLLMLAGLASDSRSWGPLMGPLSDQFYLIMPDNQACGCTVNKQSTVSLSAMVDDYAALIDHVADGQADMLGHSMGAMLTAQLAARFPAKAKKIILAAGAARISPPMKHLIRDMAALRQNMAAANQPEELWFRLLFQWLFAPAFFNDDRAVKAAAQLSVAMPNAQSADNFSAQVDAIISTDLTDMLPLIKSDTLLLKGSLDRFASGAEPGAAFDTIKDTTSITLENAGHSLHWDQPQAFANAVISFLATH